jgi:Kdo2-lipid IVA lauroyltransferase/acyltransferase
MERKPDEKQRSLALDYTVYLAVRLVVCVLQALPYRLALHGADALAWLAHRVDKRHRLVADENLRHAFPEMSDPERAKMVWSVYRHFCRLLIHIIHIPQQLNVRNWKRHVEMQWGGLVDVALSGRPYMMLTGHFGNWELGGYLMGLIGFGPTAVARELDNVYLDRFLRTFREGTGQRIVDKDDGRAIEAVLERGEALATLADQDAGQKGMFVDFFGRPAATHKVAWLAIRHNAPIVVVGVAYLGEPLRFCGEIEDVIFPENYAHYSDGGARAITERFTQALERVIRRHPEQYFWLHRRWKHQPKVRQKKVA